jgi:hypothetical protein
VGRTIKFAKLFKLDGIQLVYLEPPRRSIYIHKHVQRGVTSKTTNSHYKQLRAFPSRLLFTNAAIRPISTRARKIADAYPQFGGENYIFGMSYFLLFYLEFLKSEKRTIYIPINWSRSSPSFIVQILFIFNELVFFYRFNLHINFMEN